MSTRTTWRAAGVTVAVAMAAVLLSAQPGSADDRRTVTASETGTIITDTFHTTTEQFTERHVAGADGRPFLANISAQCVFDLPDGITALTSTIVSLQFETPDGPSASPTQFRESSTSDGGANVVTVVTGPVAAFDGDDAPTYHVTCLSGTGNANHFVEANAQAWLQVLP